MRSEPTVPITSEMIEPFAASMVGKVFARCEQAKARNDGSLEGELMRFWWLVSGLNRIAIAVSTATHFSISVMNEQRRVAEYIKHETGVDPWTDPVWSTPT